jgi:hypothetical protein
LVAQCTGWWYGEFEGEWIARQIEIYIDRDEGLVGGRDIEGLVDQPLDATRLADDSGENEITQEAFEMIWRKYYRG